LGYHWAEKDVAATIYSWDSPSYREFPEWYRYHATLSGFWQASPIFELKASLYSDAYHDRFVSYLTRERNEDDLEYDSRLENWTTGMTVDAKLRNSNRVSWHGGFSLKRDLMNKQPDRDQPWFSRHTYTSSLFLQGAFQFAEIYELTSGLGFNSFFPENAELQSVYLCPSLTLRSQLPWQLHGHIGYTRAIRFPTIHQLYSEGSGNENLKPELAHKYEVGFERWFFQGIDTKFICFELLLFYNDLSNLIYRESRSYQFRNIGVANLYGWEMQIKWQHSSRLRAELGYGWLESSRSSEEILEEVPKHSFHILLGGTSSFGTELNYKLSYFGERTTYRENLILAEYGVHDINISQMLWSRLNLRFEVSNITDVDYQEELGYPAPGRQFLLGFTWKL
jgi:iron complex outermembrane receptor protein